MLNKNRLSLILGGALTALSGSALAIPTLQIGAYAGAGDSGTYADYIPALHSPSEADTATTSDNTILVAGNYSGKIAGSDILNLGGKYTSTGEDWGKVASDAGLALDYSVFDGHGAVLVVSVADGSTGSLTVNGASAFHSDTDISYFPNDHDPVQAATSDFLFFDIGDFTGPQSTIYNFDDETGTGVGVIKELTINVSGYDWLHFDVMALASYTDKTTGKNKTTFINADLENNPGSKDVTWKEATSVSAPSTLAMLSLGLLGFAARRKRS
ncbi:choice-of-anchor N protein [Pseudomonadota bacterium]